MSKLEMTQLERLREIGVYLSDVRQDQALSLEEISSHTYIPLRILRAIEAGDDQTLPEPVFVQGFIRRYADALGLDGQAIAHEFPIYVQPLQSDCIDDDPLVTKPAPWQFPSLKFFKSSPVSTAAQSPNWPLIALAAVGAIALGGMIYGVSRRVSQANMAQSSSPPAEELSRETAPPAPEISDSPAVAGNEASDEETAEEDVVLFAQSIGASLAAPGIAVAETVTEKTDAPVQVEVSLSRRSWMQVTVDGVSDFEGIMEAGTTQTWLGEEQITVLAGDAGAVSIATNGGSPRLMGDDGSIAEITVMPETDAEAPL